MSDRICGTCGTKFKFPCHLERHLNGIVRCKPRQNIIGNICQYCNLELSSKYNLARHQQKCKAKIEAETKQEHNIQNNAQLLNQLEIAEQTSGIKINNIYKLTKKDLDVILLNDYKIKIFDSLISKALSTGGDKPLLQKILDNARSIEINDIMPIIKPSTITQSANTLNNILNPAVNNITNTSNTSNTVSNISNISNIQNIQNNTIQNIQNTQNNVVNNNHLPNIIYPFDYEDISFITDDEKLNILTSYNGVELALEKIYSKPENRNFFRQNSNKDNISILGKDMKVQIKNIKQFNEQILNKGVLLMERMFYTCKNRLAFSDQLLIWNNIEKNRELLGYEYNLVNIMNMIETYFRDPISKDIFKKFSDKLCREETYRKDKINVMKDLIIELERFNQDKTNVTINDDFLRQEVWSQEEAKSKEADGDNIKNNLNLVRVEETPRFKFFIDMRKEEIEYFDMHGASIGNIIKYRSILLQRAKEEIDRINRLYNNDALGDEVRTKLINQTNSDMMSHLQNIKFNNDVGVDADVDIELVNTITES